MMLQLSAADKIQRVAQQQGLSVASQQSGEQDATCSESCQLCRVGKFFNPIGANGFKY